MRVPIVLVVGVNLGLANAACADIITFDDFEEWEGAVGAFTTIGFTGFPDNFVITDQYADLGALFVDGNDNIMLNEIYETRALSNNQLKDIVCLDS